MKLIAIAVLLLSISACTSTQKSASQPKPAEPTSPLELAMQSSVSLIVETDNGETFGSGVIYDDQGHIITVHHVVARAVGILVLTGDGHSSTATIVGADPIADIAILKVNGDLPPNSRPAILASAVRAGQSIWSIGNPFGTSRFGGQPSVSRGVISATSRSYFNPASERLYLDSLQHDAPTNPGNSGGGVFNLRGELVGLNALITTMHDEPSSSGVAFAIPTHLLIKYTDALLAGRKISHGWFGEESLRPATEVLENGWGRMRTAFGPMAPNGPGAKKGILPGDVIIKIDGQSVYGMHEILTLEDSLNIGQTVEITVNRAGIELPIRIVVADRPWRE